MITRVQIFGLPSPDKRIQTEKNIPLLTVHFSSRQVTRIPNRGWLCKTRDTRSFRAILYRKVWILTKEWNKYCIKMHKYWKGWKNKWIK